MNDKLTLCVDFDGVIATYGETDGHLGCGIPMPGAQYVLQKWANLGHRIIVYTSRPDDGTVLRYLRWYKIPFHEIQAKPQAHLYIDDRGFRFNNWLGAEKFVELNEEEISVKLGQFHRAEDGL